MNIIESFVEKGLKILTNPDEDIIEFGYLLNEYWHVKKSLNKKISNPAIDKIYNKAIKAGAIGGKLLGSGGGGFLLFFVKPENLDLLKSNLKPLVHVHIKFEKNGSKIVLYEPDGI